MLDDLKYIHQKDSSDALGIAARQYEQLVHDFRLPSQELSGVENVVYAGMGGSALPGDILTSWPTLSVPFTVVRDYDLPAYVGKNTLVIVSSYSGNTEETLSALAQALKKGAQVAVIAAGGELQKIAQDKNLLFAQIPRVAQPRYAVFYNLRASLDILDMAGLIREDWRDALAETSAFLRKEVEAWTPQIPTANNPAKQLAQELLGVSVVVYAGPKMYPAAYKWKISCNENAKQVAWTGRYPEFNHNEFMGWTEQPVLKPYAVVDLRSKLEHPRVRKRFALSARLLSGMRPAPIAVEPHGDTLIQQLLWFIAYGDFVTLYLGILNGLDPAPIDLAEKFKKELAQ